MNNYNLPPLLQTIEELHQEWNTNVILTCFIEDKLVGSVRGTINKDGICSISKLIVDPEQQNKGIGKALMAAIEKEFAHCTKYTLFTGSDTPNTFYLYCKLGYKETDRQTNNGITMIYMEKENNPLL
ncbi:MAG: GNAT family N-acetyltransferase [Tannerellaceae bacterium]|nr:GNAT family N-acetyltransferase [Tannerellaceae bacterium]MCD8265121.1 GNAT family N-acetyltransferase [Tannerellaceae bacterium]